jgi:hypothetical protein
LFTELAEDEYTIGRGDNCKIKITLAEVNETILQSVSREHCRIVRTASEVYLEDHSSNGTYVNFEKIGKDNKRILKNHDQISLVVPEIRGMCVNECLLSLGAESFVFQFAIQELNPYSTEVVNMWSS